MVKIFYMMDDLGVPLFLERPTYIWCILYFLYSTTYLRSIPNPVTVTNEGLGREPRTKNGIMLVATGILGGE